MSGPGPAGTGAGSAGVGPARDTRTCFLVLSHTEPNLVERLVRVLVAESPGSTVVVRHDSGRTPLEARRFADLPRVDVVEHRGGSAWGSWDLTRSTVSAVAHALDHHRQWTRLVVISGQSYPLQPVGAVATALADDPRGALLDLAPEASQGVAERRGWRPYGADRARYHYRALPWTPLWELHHARQPLLSITRRQPRVGFSFHRDPSAPQRFRAQLTLLAANGPFAGGLRPLKASQWWAISRDAAERTRRLLDPADPWAAHFRHVFTSDELSVPSLLRAKGVDVGHVPLHALWWPSGPSPATLTREHLPWLADRAEPFTRKVSLTADADLLNEIDALRASRAASATRGAVRA